MKIHFFLASIALCAATAAAQNFTSCANLLTPTPPCYNLLPTRSFGPARQVNPPTSAAPNLVEGREFFQPYGIAFDTTSSPPIMYVVDAGNNRVLGWKMAGSFGTASTADIVVGQRDKYSTLAQGPASGFGSGLSTPVAITVDAAGNLWVVDGGNNRILRYPKPATQTDTVSADIVIGQASIGAGATANRGGSVGANTLAYGTNGNSQAAGIAFDPAGNLWVTDYGNNRVLRYAAASLVPNTDISADFVLGQQTLTTNTLPSGANANIYNKSAIVGPLGLAISQSGGLYVSDSYRRVLYYGNAFAAPGQQAIRLLGVIQRTTADTVVPAAINGCPSSGTPGCDQKLGTTSIPPVGLAVIGETLYVADLGNSRVVRYLPPPQWQPECPYAGGTPAACPTGTVLSPTPASYLGQTTGLTTLSEKGARVPAIDSLSGPIAVAAGPNGELWVADTSNNRVLVFTAPTVTGSAADPARILGQSNPTMSAANLLEGRELYIIGVLGGSLISGNAVVDAQNHLFIADTFNNRVLGFRDYRSVKVGVAADIVIGQADLLHGIPNSTSPTDATTPSQSSFSGPAGVAVDSAGNLWVADTFNGRVLRFPNPFGQTGTITANLVLGKASFTVPAQNQSDVNRATMRTPYRMAFASDGSLAVSDFTINRVLIFRKPSGGDFATGQSADLVIGQADFVSSAVGNGTSNMSSPRGVAFDPSDRLYVADAGNSRLLVFPRIGDLANGSRALFSKSFTGTQGVAVSKTTGEIWVTATTGQVLRYPAYESLSLSPDNPALGTLGTAQPTAVALDPFDNPIVVDAYNRVAFFYPAATFQNSASFANDLSGSALTPGMLALLYRYASPNFNAGGVVQSDTIPVPTTLADIQVTVNGILSPIYRVMPDRIDFWVPWSAPTSGTAEVVATRVSTGEVLASAIIPMNVAAPAFYTAAQNGSGQISAYNIKASDGSAYGVNSTTNPVAVGDYVAIFGTGIGPVPNAPADGQLSGNAPAPTTPTVTVGPKVLTAADIGYFGLAPNLVGLFQLNIRIPQGTAPGPAVLVGMIYRDIPSTTGPVVGGRVQTLRTTVAVK